jgi:hypothetical protein
LAKPDSQLAYEHEVSIELGADGLLARMVAVREACTEGLHGPCSLLEVNERSGRQPNGRLRMRLSPEAVEPVVSLASDAGQLASRSTRAEDLSASIADTGRQRAQLELQLQRLNELAARKDLSVADQLNLARELSAPEVQLQASERESANQTRRLETNLMTIHFSVPADQVSRWGSLGEAWNQSIDSFVEGLIEAIGMLVYLLPYLFFAFPLALTWWLLWRVATRRFRREPSQPA